MFLCFEKDTPSLKGVHSYPLFTLTYSPLYRGITRIEMRDRKDALTAVAEMSQKTKVQAALNWCISHDNVIAIPKASTIEHVEEDCYASGWRLSPQQIRLLESSIRPVNRVRGRFIEVNARRLARRIRRLSR